MGDLPNDEYILDANNCPIQASLPVWYAFMRDSKARQVGFTNIGSEVQISTVFLGLDYREDLSVGNPILFETMVSAPEREGDGETHRYSSWSEAEAGHVAVVEFWQRKMNTEARSKGAAHGNL